MSSECWVERCSDSQAEETGLEKHQEKGKKKGETEVACGNNQSAGSMRQEGPGTEESSSPDHSGGQVVTSEGGQEQIQREETQTRKEGKRCSHLPVNEGNERVGPVSGARVVARHLRMSKPRGSLNCSRARRRQSEEPGGLGPFYFIGGSNGAEIVSDYCKSRGWKRTYDKHREDFKLKWCETKSTTNYSHFKEGEQLLYQIPNNKVLTTKIGLLSSLREYERVSSKIKHGQELRRMKMEEFIPTTFRMDVKEERETFFAQQEGLSINKTHMWICKPTGLNQGRGIFLLKSQQDVAAFRLKLQRMEESKGERKIHQRQPQAHIVQHYIQSPLLLEGKKFDVRSYLLIACTAPYMVFFRHGYVRLTCDLYDPSSNNLSAHLTNQYMQKKNPLYSQLKEDTVWSMESFNAYVNDRFQVAKGLPRDWVLGVFAKRMQEIMTHCFFAVKPKLDCRLGFFDLIGCDFLVDEDFKVWLLEMNCNPALHTNCEVLKEVIPSTVMETLDLTLEIFNKCRLRQSILPLDSQREFMLLYSGVLTPTMQASSKSKRNIDFHLKTKKKTEARWCTSRTEGNGVPTDSVNAAVRGEGRGSIFDHSPTTFPLHPNTSSIQEPSHEPSSTSSTQTIRSKNTRPRAELKLSKCTLHHRLKAADDLKNSNAQQTTALIMCLTSQAQREQSSAGGSPERPFPSCTGPPACTDEYEEEKLKEDVTSVEDQRKEEL